MSLAPRSVGELLPQAFERLTLDDVREVVTAGNERETIFMEWKSELTPDAVAKAAAAFANTHGGLLLGGVDDGGEIVGFEPRSGEIELWVKDVLRSRVLPRPPFRARLIPLPNETSRAILLMLVEESSTTPHLLTRTGAIYVRSPGSSEPVPIGDQALLLDLTRRGREARENATRRARQALEQHFEQQALYTLGLAPTGIGSDVIDDLYVGRQPIEQLDNAVRIHDLTNEPNARESTEFTWSQHRLQLARYVDRSFTAQPEALLDGLVVHSDGALQIQRCLLPPMRGGEIEPRGPEPLYLDTGLTSVIGWLQVALERGRQLILSLGGHGDLRVAVRIQTSGRYVFYAEGRAEVAKRDFGIEMWVPLDVESDHASAPTEHVRDAMLRDLGVWLGPRAPFS